MQLPLPASHRKPPDATRLDVGLLALLAALIFFLVATTANGLSPSDLGGWVGDSLTLAGRLEGRRNASL